MIYLAYKTKKDNQVFSPVAICSDYYLSMYLSSKFNEDFTTFSNDTEVKLIPPSFTENQLRKMTPNCIVDSDMQNFYKSQPEFLAEINAGIAFDWINGIRIYNSSFKDYEIWLSCNELESILNELANFFHRNLQKRDELTNAMFSCFKLLGAISVISEMFRDNVEIAILDGE